MCLMQEARSRQQKRRSVTWGSTAILLGTALDAELLRNLHTTGRSVTTTRLRPVARGVTEMGIEKLGIRWNPRTRSIQKLGIRWGRGQKISHRREDNLSQANAKIRELESDLSAMRDDLGRMRMMIEELADASDVYLPTFKSRSFKE